MSTDTDPGEPEAQAAGASHGTQEDADLRLLADAARDFAMIFTDPDRRVVRWSKGAEHVLGWTEDEARGANEVDLIFTPEDKAAGVPRQEQDTALRDGRAEDERWHMRKGGRRFFASGVMVPLRDPDTGNLRGFGKILRDVTDRKRAQEARSFLASVVQSLEDSVVTIDFDGVITSWNRAAETLYGYRADEVIGKPLTMLTLSEDLARVLDYVEQIKHRRKVKTFDTARVRKGGRHIDLEIVLSPVEDERGRVIGVSTVARDVMARKQVEQALRAAREELEARVEERTAALETSLSERRALSRQLVGVQEEERQNISRELHDQTGQDLTALALGLAALEPHVSGPEGGHRLAGLRRQADALARGLHRIAVELRPTSLEDVGLPQALESYVQEWQGRFGGPTDFDARGFGQEIPRLPQEVETTIYRVVQEALTNVLRHAAGASRVGVLLEHRPGEARCIVEDDGPGFDPEAATARLGLRGMRERAELAGGTLEIESAPGSGTTVFLRLPLQAQSA